MFVLSRKEMYAFDKYTIEQIGIPGKELMENAGRGCAEFMRDRLLKDSGKIAVFCGAGNNGGDGFVIARYLKEWKYETIVFLLNSPAKMSAETRENYEACRELKIEIMPIQSADFELSDYDLIVDAIFGVGLQGTIQGWRAEIIERINSAGKTVVAIDIASGIDADTGAAEIAVQADFTLTMASFKYGQLLEKGRQKSGETLVVDIGIPASVYEKFPPRGKLITSENVLYPQRSRYSHKGDFGRVGIIAGSPGFSGAAVLAARAALRAGAGLITLFHPAGMELIFEIQLLEVMTQAMPSFQENEIEKKKFWLNLMKMDALLIGPGIGTQDTMKNLLTEILEIWQKPLVLDADALNIIAENRQLLQKIKSKSVILTPHLGEFARLTGKSAADVQADPIKALNEFIGEFECHVLLKSSTSIYGNKDNLVFDISGNDGLATGGSGDVLAGMIVSFLGQKLNLCQAAVSASFLLGETAEKLAEFRNTASIIPSDIIENLFKF